MINQTKLIKDYGKRKALQNEFLIISTKFGENQDNFNSLMKFTIETIPDLISKNQPLPIKSYSNEELSPYPHIIESFIENNCKDNSSIAEVIKNMDLDRVSKAFKKDKIELIGIDESRVEMPLQGSRYAYLKSVAFRMSKNNGEQQEVVGPLVRDLEISFEDNDTFEKKIQFWGYLRNLYVAYLAIYNAVKGGFNPVVFMHGPLVRTIGGFTDIFLTKEDAIRILSVSSELDDFEGTIFCDDEGHKLIDGELLLKDFHGEELENYDIIYASSIEKINQDSTKYNRWQGSLPFDENINPITFEQRKRIPGISLYFWLVRRLYSLCDKHKVPFACVVENIESSTEFVQYVLPSLFNKNNSDIPNEIISMLGRRFPPKNTPPEIRQFPKKFYRYIFYMIKNLSITDSVVTTYLLDEGDFTTPIQTFRYLNREFFVNHLGHSEYGMSNDYKSIVNYYLNPEEKGILFSFLRTTPIREPIRVEFFDIYENNYDEILGATFLLSLFYPNFGLPIILYYVDKIARTHKEYPKIILELVLLDTLMEGKFKAEDVLRISKKLSRNFWRR